MKSKMTQLKNECRDGFLDVMGNGLMWRKVIRAGNGEKPDHGNEVVVRLWQNTSSETTHCFVIGDNEFSPCGVDLAVRLMMPGEKSEYQLHHRFSLAYGEYEKDSTSEKVSEELFSIVIELVNVKGLRPEISVMKSKERLRISREKARCGNEFFKNNEFHRAIQCYINGCKFADVKGESSAKLKCKNVSAEIEQACAVELERLRCNAATTFLKLGQKKMVKKYAKAALSSNPKCAKAHLRLGELAVQEQKWKVAKQHLIDAKRLKPNASAVQSAMKKLREERKKSRSWEGNFFSKKIGEDEIAASCGKTGLVFDCDDVNNVADENIDDEEVYNSEIVKKENKVDENEYDKEVPDLEKRKKVEDFSFEKVKNYLLGCNQSAESTPPIMYILYTFLILIAIYLDSIKNKLF
eukprot:g4100.t1